jgi:hypothetical protein
VDETLKQSSQLEVAVAEAEAKYARAVEGKWSIVRFI